MNEVELAIRVATEAADATRGLDSVGDAARDMARDVDKAADTAKRSVEDMTDKVDGLGSTSAQAAGGLGDLGGALGLLPGPLGSLGGGLETAGTALMGVTGAADLVSLAMNSSALATVRARAATIAKTVAEKAAAAAAKAMTVAQWALNAAMSANPIGLIIIAVIALVAGFVLLYKRSETVRKIVDKVWAALKTAGRWIVDLTKKVGTFLLKWSPMGIALRLVRDNFGQVTGKIRDLYGWIKDKLLGQIEMIRTSGGRVGQWLKDKFVGFINAAIAPFRTLKDAIADVIEWLGKIKIPDALSNIGGALGNLPGLGRITGRPVSGAGGRGVVGATSTTNHNYTFNVYGALDADGVARTIESMIAARQRRLGLT